MVLMMVLIVGCSGMKPEDFAGTEPEFILEEYFQGKSKAWGIFQDRFGNLRREFTVDIDGTWDGSKLTLVEDFVYSDGETEQRVWEITKTGDKRYRGTADGVVGEAVGVLSGKAFNFRYQFDLPLSGSTLRVNFDDWMWLQPEGQEVINKARVSKLGVTLGERTIFFQKLPAVEQAAFAEAAE